MTNHSTTELDKTLGASLQHALERWQRFAPCAGTNVSVHDAARGAWHGASGLAEVDTGEPMRPGARAYVYSITKSFTAVLVLRLVESGALGLDDPIARYLPGAGCPPAVTVRQLLNHTSGVPSYTDFPDYADAVSTAPGAPWSLDAVLERCRGLPEDFASGEGWHYSNTGYALLYRLIETVAGQPFAEALREEIAGPLGLADTFAATEPGGGPDGRPLTPGYDRAVLGVDVPEDIVALYHPLWCLTGLVVSTTADVARFYAALFAGELLQPSSLAAMREGVPCGPESAPSPNTFFRRPAYGLGLMLDEGWAHGGFHGHGGDGPGFNTFAMHVPRFEGHALTIVVFCNTSMPRHPLRLCRILLDVLSRDREDAAHPAPMSRRTSARRPVQQ